MKAVDFIKKFGWEMSKAFLNNWSSLSEDYGFKVDDLKRCVDAWELVQLCGGIDGARKYAHKDPFDYHNQYYLLQAIALVEEVENENTCS